MKRIIIFLVSLLTLASLGSKADPGDVLYVEINKESTPEVIPRSSTTEIERCYWTSTGLLELSFNLNAVNVTIEINDQTTIINE